MAQIFNEQRVLGVRIVSDGTMMHNGRQTIGIRDAGDALFVDNLRTLGVDVLDADAAIYNEQPVLGAVLITDARTLYNGERVVPVSGVAPVPSALTPPAGLDWTAPVNVYPDYTTDYDPAAREASWLAAYPSATTFYADNAAGNNNNDGLTSGTAFRSLDLAIKMGQDTGAAFRVIYKAGTLASPAQYRYSNSQARSGQATNNATWRDAWCSVVVTVPMMLVPDTDEGRADSIFLASAPTLRTVTADPAIFKIQTNATNLVDYSNRSRLGAPRPLVMIDLAPANEADALVKIAAEWARLSALDDGLGDTHAEGVYWRDELNVCANAAATTYFRLFDGRDPTAAVTSTTTGTLLRPDTGTASHRIAPASGSHLYYIEGVNFMGGASGALKVTANTGASIPTIDCVRCTFVGGLNAGAFWTEGSTGADGVMSILYRCEASGGGLDGFNYHQNNRSVEIDCEAYWNGRDFNAAPGLANNGSTQHETGRALTVNGRYLYSQDRSLHDVGTSKRWALGSVSGTRRAVAGGAGGPTGATSAAWAVGHPNGSATVMWLDGCAVRPGPWGAAQYPFECYATATLNYANMDAPTGNPGAGTIQAYTP